MKESQSHQAFAKWLDHEKIPYVHSRTDRKHTNTVGDCDFYCFLAGRVIGIEFKVGKNKLSIAQEKRIAYLRQAGIAVRVAYSCEEAIQAVSEHFGVVNAATGRTEAQKQAPDESEVQCFGCLEKYPFSNPAAHAIPGSAKTIPCAKMVARKPQSDHERLKSDEASGASLSTLYIKNWQQTPWVCQEKLIGEGPDLLIRPATPRDLMNIHRR